MESSSIYLYEITWGSSLSAEPRYVKGLGNDDKCTIFITSILPTCVDQTVFLVLCFWFPAPVWCLVFSVLLFLVALFFGFVHRLGIVFRRRIDCVENLESVLSVGVFGFLETMRHMGRKKTTSGVGPVLTN